jgi:hypothetical protein
MRKIIGIIIALLGTIGLLAIFISEGTINVRYDWIIVIVPCFIAIIVGIAVMFSGKKKESD